MRFPAALAALLAAAGCGHYGALQVDSTPPGAAIILDGDSSGLVTPHLFTNLYSGIHLVELCRDPFRSTDTVWPAEADTTTVSAFLPTCRWMNSSAWDASIALAPDGRVYAAGHSPYSGGQVTAIDPDGTTAWAFELEDNLWNAPAVGDNGTVYLATSKRVLALSPDGDTLWEYEFTSYASGPGIALAADGAVYVSSADRLLCLGPNGNWRWQANLWSQAETPPAIGPDGTVYVATGTAVFAFDPNGTLRWSREVHLGDGTGVGGIAIADDGAIFVSYGGTIAAFSPGGTMLWSRHSVGSGQGSAPVLGLDGTIFATVGAGLLAVSPAGESLWQNNSVGSIECPAVTADGSIVTVGGALRSIGPDGTTKWCIRSVRGSWWHTPAVGESALYVNTDRMVCSIPVGLMPAQSAWPQFQHDARRTGRFGAR